MGRRLLDEVEEEEEEDRLPKDEAMDRLVSAFVAGPGLAAGTKAEDDETPAKANIRDKAAAAYRAIAIVWMLQRFNQARICN